MKKYVLAALLAMTLAGGASAQVISAVRPAPGTVRSVPDSGSTVALLGLSVILVVLAQRKLAKSQ